MLNKMAENKLPIKLFYKKQKIDDRKVEGGGSYRPPKWQLDGDELLSRANNLLKPLDELDIFLIIVMLQEALFQRH